MPKEPMTVRQLIDELKKFPQDYRIVIFPDEGWSDIENVKVVFENFVALFPPDAYFLED